MPPLPADAAALELTPPPALTDLEPRKPPPRADLIPPPPQDDDDEGEVEDEGSALDEKVPPEPFEDTSRQRLAAFDEEPSESGIEPAARPGVEEKEPEPAVLTGPQSVDPEGIFTSLRGFLEEELDRSAEMGPRERAVLLFELGHLEEVVFGEVDGALVHYEQAFREDPTFLASTLALRRHYEVRGQWSELLRVMLAEAKVAPDEVRRSALLAEIGELQMERLSDTPSAVKSLKAALSLNPKNLRAASSLKGLYARLEQGEDLLEVLRSMANVIEDKVERARILVEMAELCEFRLGKTPEAVELFTQSLVLDPENEVAQVALRRLYLIHEHWRELAELLAREAGREREPDERYTDLYRAARIAELHLQDDGKAASLLETAAVLRPGDPLPLQALATLYQRMGRHDAVVSVLGRLLRVVREPADRAELHHRLGRAFEDWLEQPDQAVSSFCEALKEQPGHEATLRALAALYERLERWEDLLEVELLRAERARDPVRRADGYVRAAAISELRVKDTRRAVDLYERAERIQAGLPEAFRSLQRIYRRTGKFEALAELYERGAESTADEEQALGLMRRAARLYEEQLQNRERAVALFEKILERRPEDREALLELSRLYEEAGRIEDLRRTLASWADLTLDSRDRIELRRRIAELYEGPLRKLEQAIALYLEILRDAPSDRPTLERLKALFERTSRWQDLVETLRLELTVTPKGPEQAPILVEIARLCLHKLGEVDQARAALEEALREDPTYTPATSALQELLLSQGLFEKLVEMLLLGADRPGEPVRAAAMLCLAGEVCEEQLCDAARASRCYTRALELDPRSGPARDGLERLYLAAKDVEALGALYATETRMATSPDRRLRAYLRLARLFDGARHDTERAAAAYQSALEVEPSQPDAQRALVAVYRRTERWDRLAALLLKVADTSHDRDSALTALREWFSIARYHLPGAGEVPVVLDRILEASPGDPQALAALELVAYIRRDVDALIDLARRRIHYAASAAAAPEQRAALAMRAATLLIGKGRSKEAADLLREGLKASPRYLPIIRLLRRLDEQLGEWKEVTELLLLEGALAHRPELAHSALLRAGSLLIERYGDVARARAAFERVFGEDPGSESAFANLVTILSRGEEWRPLSELYLRRMGAVEPPALFHLQLELAAIYRDHLEDTASAISVLTDLLSVDPDNHPALGAISQLCVAQKRWREAEGYLERLAAAARGDPETRRHALLVRSQILEEHLSEQDLALEVARTLEAENPGDRDVLTRCLSLYQRRSDFASAVEVLGELARTGTPAERLATLVDLAELYSRSMGDEERALAAIRKAASLCVDGSPGIERIGEYFERRGDFEGYADLLGGELDKLPPEGSPGAVTVRLARARVLAGRLLRPADAAAEVRKALQSDPASLPARLELAGLHLWGDNLGEATAEYLRVLDRDPFSVEGFRGLFRVYERRGDMERAAGAAQVVCAIAGNDVPERKLADQISGPIEMALASAVATPLGVADYWHLLAHPDEPAAARELFYQVADFVPQIFAADMERFEVGEDVFDDDPLSTRCARLAQVLGVKEFQCRIGHHHSGSVGAAPGNPPRIVVDERFAKRAKVPELHFAMGRALAEILSRSLYLQVLQHRTMEILLAAVVELFERGFGAYLGQPREVEELSKAVGRLMPRKQRKAVEEVAHQYAASPHGAIETWANAAQRSAERAGLLLSGDVGSALSVMSAGKGGQKAQTELLRFAIGPHLYEARRRLGLSIEE
jgi:cellulose synthase operon protein C